MSPSTVALSEPQCSCMRSAAGSRVTRRQNGHLVRSGVLELDSSESNVQ